MTEVAEDKRLYKIGEVCRIADVQPYVLRYWETEFAALAPNKSGGGQRLYTQREIDIILRIKQLLYSEGFTIAGAKKKLEAEQASPEPVAAVSAPPPTEAPRSARDDKARAALVDVKRELNAILDLLGE
ncbi:MAG TPA: MerR family transcriptional regulator [Thermoanaerobaculia bacterium]|nr:MerR family transcriptional regulator [Thermoanaerobaculia bacterium]